MTRQQETTAMHQPIDNSRPEPGTDDSAETIKTRVIAALAEARKARHHRDCYCRHFDRSACNAADALWTRAYTRELSKLYPEPVGD